MNEETYKKITELTYKMDELCYFVGVAIDQNREEELNSQAAITTIEQIEAALKKLKED